MTLYAMEQAYLSRLLFAVENIPQEEAEQARAAFSDVQGDSIAANTGNGEATIRITGPLSESGPGFIEQFLGFGGTSYADIVDAAEQLKADPSIKTVRLAMNTPGGQVSGMDRAREAIASLADSKEVIAENHGTIASAGYFLASAATRIEALSPFARTGSIGVVVAGIDPSGAMEKAGIKRIRIVSSNAPKKQPDPTTQDGRDIIQQEIDATERVFIQKIAEGRGVTPQYVIDNFGKGGVLIAEDPDASKPSALSAGLIDSVRTGATAQSVDSSGATEASSIDSNIQKAQDMQETESAERGYFKPKEGTIMDLNELKAKHPALYAEAVEAGVLQERERVGAHLTMADASGDMDLAVQCINDGAELTSAINAKYMASGMKNQHRNDRREESPGDVNTSEADAAESKDDELAALVAERVGVEVQDNV